MTGGNQNLLARHDAFDDIDRLAAQAGLDPKTADPAALKQAVMEQGAASDREHGQGATDEQVAASLTQLLSRPDAAEAYASLPGTMGGKILNVDEARKLSPEYVADPGRYSVATHGPSSEFIKRLLAERLRAEPTGSVLLLAGGGGSGKSTVINGYLAPGVADADIMFDAVLGDFSRARNIVDEAIASRRAVDVVYVHRPFEAAVEGVANRAQTEGRIVPPEVLAKAHAGAQDTILRLGKLYADNEFVRVAIIDNSGVTAQPMSLDDLATVRYDQRGEGAEATAAKLLPIARKGLSDARQVRDRRRASDRRGVGGDETAEANRTDQAGDPGEVQRAEGEAPGGSRSAGEAPRGGQGPVGDLRSYDQPAYHGSPHKLDKFTSTTWAGAKALDHT
ncbi:MAG: zeta toxin family protein [Planctomycetes bacterium]|nr:zeta toxin family protein [Planctomycetota bacterium]